MVQSYVTGDKVYCVYNADNEQLNKDHATQVDFLPIVFQKLKISCSKTAE